MRGLIKVDLWRKLWMEQWRHDYCTHLQIELSKLVPWPAILWLLSEGLFPPRCVNKWMPEDLMLGVTLQWTSIPSRKEYKYPGFCIMKELGDCYRIQDKLQPDGTLSSYTDLSLRRKLQLGMMSWWLTIKFFSFTYYLHCCLVLPVEECLVNQIHWSSLHQPWWICFLWKAFHQRKWSPTGHQNNINHSLNVQLWMFRFVFFRALILYEHQCSATN